MCNLSTCIEKDKYLKEAVPAIADHAAEMISLPSLIRATALMGMLHVPRIRKV
jgi:hypothetical protein